VLEGLELQRGHVVDRVLEKRFKGDLQMGLKVLGKYSLSD